MLLIFEITVWSLMAHEIKFKNNYSTHREPLCGEKVNVWSSVSPWCLLQEHDSNYVRKGLVFWGLHIHGVLAQLNNKFPKNYDNIFLSDWGAIVFFFLPIPFI